MAMRQLAEQLDMFTVRQLQCKHCRELRPEHEFRKGDKVLRSCHACRVKNREYESFHRLAFLYGITREQYHAILETQHGGCGICGRAYGMMRGQRVRLGVDHDHSTDRVRGLLCNQCNRRLGFHGDNLKQINRQLVRCKQDLARIERQETTQSREQIARLERRVDFLRRASVYLQLAAEAVAKAEADEQRAREVKVCAICGEQETECLSLSVDCDQVSGKERGVLCGVCKRRLEVFHDNAALLAASAAYLRRYAE